MISLQHAAYFVPSTTCDVEEAAEWLGIPSLEAKVFKRIYGLSQIPVAKDMSIAELLAKPIEKLCDEGVLIPEEVKLIIHAHTAQILTPFGYNQVRELKHAFGLQAAAYMGTSMNNCASALSALDIAANYLQGLHEKDKVLIIVGEKTFTESLRVLPNITVVGDASVALLVGRSSVRHVLCALCVDCYGEFAGGLWLDDSVRVKFELNFPFLLKKVVDAALAKANLLPQDICFVLPHNVNLRLWREIAKILGYRDTQVITENIPKHAHCFGSDVFINFITANQRHLLKPGTYYLMVTAGLGATVGAAVFKS